MAITSRVRTPIATGEALLENWQETGLLKPSLFKPLIAEIEKVRISKVIGHISNNDKERLDQILQSILGNE